MNQPNIKNLTGCGNGTGITRRRFLKGLAYGPVMTLGAPKLVEAAFTGFSSYKSLSLEHHHTGESIDLTYFEQGRYIAGAMEEISYFLRDYHNEEVHRVDPALLDQLYDIKLLLGSNKPFHIVSGYRSPQTNANLRRHSRSVARHSLHMEGKAVDIRIEGVGTRSIRDVALALQGGGVGYYPHSNFVHIDTGDIRTWRGY